jgi:hypothetical protein
MGKSRRLIDRVAIAVLGGCLLIFAGCSRGAPAPRGAIWVKGTARFDGQPLEKGVVQFFAVEGAASGATRIRNGRFGLYLQPTDYTVAVIAEESHGYEAEDGTYVPSKSLIPLRYGDITTSGLSAHVDESQRSVVLELAR